MSTIAPVLVLLLVGLIASQSTIQQIQAQGINAPLLFVIKGEQVDSARDAVTIARRFLPKEMVPEERCARLAVVLNTRRPTTDSFQVAEKAQAKLQFIRDNFVRIDIDSLRQLYQNAITDFVENQQIDAGLVELVRCLRNKFGTVDRSVSEFLNRNELKTLLDQYDKVAKAPLRFLVDGLNGPDIPLEQLRPELKHSIARWLGGDVERVERLFGGDQSQVLARAESVASSAPIPAWPLLVAQSQVPPEPRPQAQPQPQPEFQPQSPQTPPQPELQPAPLSHPDFQAEFHPESQSRPDSDEELSEADHRFLNILVGSINQAHFALPSESKIGDRCLVYDNLIRASWQQLTNEDYVKQLIQETIEQMAQNIVPKFDENSLKNLMFLAQYMEPLQVDSDVKIGLVDCLNTFWGDNAEVQEFINYLINEQDIINDVDEQSRDKVEDTPSV